MAEEVTYQISARTVTVKTRTHDYLAYLDGDTKKWDCGADQHEAIGKAIRTHVPDPVDLSDSWLGYVWAPDKGDYANSEIFASWEAAAADAVEKCGYPFLLGQAIRPNPAGYIDAIDVIEHLINVEPFNSEAFEDFLAHVGEPAKQELTEGVQALLAAWIKKHKLETSGWIAQSVARFEGPDDRYNLSVPGGSGNG